MSTNKLNLLITNLLKIHILLSILICLFISSCEQKTKIEFELESIGIKPENFIRIDTVFYEGGEIQSLRFHKDKNDYVDVDFYELGNKKSIGRTLNNQVQGEFIDWYENGKEKWTRNYTVGKQIGKSIKYFANGNLELVYDNSTDEIVQFWLNGKTKFKYLENKSQSYHYWNGNFLEKYQKTPSDDDEVEIFNENGKLVFSGLYKKNILFKDNLRYSGEIVCYFENGKISYFLNLKDGIPSGRFYTYYGNGNLNYEGEVQNKKEVYYKSYYESGRLKFIRDEKTFTQWRENGKMDYFSDGTKDIHWDENGKVIE